MRASECTAWEIRPLCDVDRLWAAETLSAHWGSARIVSRARVYDAHLLAGFVATRGGNRVGLITFRLTPNECEVVSLNSLDSGKGIGTALLEAVREVASAAGCQRLWLITTNDNLAAIRFYQRRGARLVAVHPGAIEESRKLKSDIPTVGIDGIPLRDEIELEWPLS